jgi:hypothetical protein
VRFPGIEETRAAELGADSVLTPNAYQGENGLPTKVR